MAAEFAELGAEGINWVTDKYYDTIYDNVDARIHKKKRAQQALQQQQQQPGGQQQGGQKNQSRGNYDNSYNPQQQNYQTHPPPQSNSGRRRQKNRLPSPEGNAPNWDSRKENQDFDRESEVSERVIRAYESERDDPSRKAESVLSKRDLKKLNSRDAAKMSYANGYSSGNLQAPSGYERRANSQQPPRGRYYDDDDSDYDERSGRRYRASGRGYDDYDDDRGYGREVIETERYRGPARDYDARRTGYGAQKGNDPYGAGAVTQYRRSTQNVDDYRSQRSRSRGRRDRGRDRSRSYSDSRSRSRSRSHSGIRGKIDDTFDTSVKGLGAGIAGAVVGGLAGREFGNKHKNRDAIIGALIGGLGANAAENKWKDWHDEKEDKLRRDEDKWENKWDGRDGRSRSAMR
ncbi:uncharacterized protein LTR77_008693 [Saxophila tyrrhenica]|uniref:Glycine zipper 2TM domain-containing protein n=1 Tax=Saxophila tyrrhenica TaxID=1690608 RepID=A0AAV9P008_9PEZI|nr:hypothetical protein LTR77_008693 [Saxophila tyrrhenica]